MAGRPNDGSVILEDVRIIFRNFSGKEGMYNRAGDRNFAVILPDELAKRMEADGWNVKYLKAREEGEEDTPYLAVAVSFKNRPPTIHMISSRGTTALDEETCEILDMVDIVQVDLIIRPYEWNVNGNKGIKAYLQSIYVTIFEDELKKKYDNMEIATVEGPAMNSSEGPLQVRSERATSRRELEEA